MRKNRVVLLILGLVGIYGFSDMKLIFYDILKNVLKLSDYQLGFVWSAFGITALVSYIIGGMIADKVHPSKLISLALIMSGLLHLLMSFVPSMVNVNIISAGSSYVMLIGISALMGICAVMMFFPASSKVIICFEKESGKELFGLYYGIGGLLTALLSLLATVVYKNINDDYFILRTVLTIYAVINIVTGLASYVILKKIEIEKVKSVERNIVENIKRVVKNRNVLMIAIVIMCNYGCCSMMTYFTPYITARYGMSNGDGMLLSVLRLGILCFVSGILASKLSNYYGSVGKVIKKIFAIMAAFFLLLIVNEKLINSFLTAVVVTSGICLFTLGIKSIGMSLISETDIESGVLGTAVGLVSVVGYSPDAWFFPMAGKILDSGGIFNFTILFIIGVILSTIGFAILLLLKGKS